MIVAGWFEYIGLLLEVPFVEYFLFCRINLCLWFVGYYHLAYGFGLKFLKPCPIPGIVEERQF